jgi:hypothetical protein
MPTHSGRYGQTANCPSPEMAFNVLDTVAVGAAAGAAGVTLANQSPKLTEAQEPFIKFQFPQTVSSVERFCGCCFCGCCGCGVWGFPLFAATATPDKRSSIVVAVDRQVLAFVFDSSCSVFDFR